MIRIATDTFHRTVVVVDDRTAERLHKLSKRGWTEVAGVGYGSSELISTNTPDGRLIESILGAVAVGGKIADDVRIAQTGSFYGFVVGESGWDDERATWRDYAATRHLHTHGSIVKHKDGWRFAG